MNYSDIQHRFANKQAGKNGRISAGNVRYEGRNFYSYSTVFGQWLDEKVCLVYQGRTSISSSKHQLGSWCFPSDVVVLPYDDGGSGRYYGSWHGCDLLGWGGEFNFDKRVTLIDYYVGKIYDSLAAINGGKRKDLDKYAGDVIYEYWGYIMKVSSLYKDTTINKWLKKKRIDIDGIWKLKKRLVKELNADNTSVASLVDILFGDGTWQAYYDYCARYRKSADKRAKVEALCKRLDIASPYESWTHGRMDTELTADEIRKLTAKQRLDLHFASIMRDEQRKVESAVKEKYNKNFRNAYKWIVGFEPKQKSWGGGYEKDVHNNCVNKDSGVVYECSGEYIFGFYWLNKSVSFDYDGFRKSEDKEQWIADFYAKCKEVADNRKAIGILKRIKAHTKEKVRSYDDDVYLNDEYLRENTTEAEYAICAEFIRKQDKYFADKEAQRRAEEIERLRKKEEERKEKEYMEQVKQEQIDECLSRGIEGKRDLWRKHLQGLYDIYDKDDDEFFMGGNVLLRMNLNKDKVETSKNIRIPVEVCKKMWKIVSKWHENPSCFKEMQIDTKGSGRYTISSYQNDILTAGCHKIAYAEMERMYNEIVKLENEAA